MLSEGFTISQLEELTRVSRRTIHFYSQEGLIPAPDSRGGGAKYSEEAYLKLKLIKELQKSHLKLSGIREALEGMTLAEMRELVASKAGETEPGWDVQSLEKWLKGEFPAPTSAPEAPEETPRRSVVGTEFSFFGVGKEPSLTSEVREPLMPDYQESEKSRLHSLHRRQPIQEATWKRYTVAEGVEVHVRSDVDSRKGTSVREWIKLFTTKRSERRK